jgi:transcriptional regulator with PAS, ATPase and Fis domain
MKTLVSWYAYQNDFDKGEVLEEGPTMSFHRYFYKYDRHILLTQAAEGVEDIRALKLLSALRVKYPERQIECWYLDIRDVIDAREIKSKVEAALATIKNDELTFYISPGTPAMQVAWYLIHIGSGWKTKMLQTREARFTKDKLKPELMKIDIEKSAIPLTVLYHQEALKSRSTEDFFITPTIEKIYKNAEKVAQTDEVTVLILGESGTGKENLAKHIHKQSPRRAKPYIAINCSAFSDSLLESRLFGYKKGAFTGAERDTIGLFEQANEGTIFLDEIGDISPYMQQALLRVLQEKEIMPLGGKAKKIDVRVIAATNQHLVQRCEEGRFRWDLYYRLSVVELDLPALVQRGKADIRQMIDYFLVQKKKVLKKPRKLAIEKEAMDALLQYSYPGNIRELENIISRLYVFNDDKVTRSVLPKRIFQQTVNQPMHIDHVEKQHIERMLAHFNGNKRQTALAIGWTYNTLMAKVQKYGIPLP